MPVRAYELRRLDGSDPVCRRDVSGLHATLLPRSPVVLLGRRFMESFYYRSLVEDDLVAGTVAYVEGVPAGFVVVTADSAGFMNQALRRHFARLALVMGTSVLTDLYRLGAMWEAWQIMRAVKSVDRGARVGEILSFGVLPAYRERKFVRATGLRLSLDLFNFALAETRRRGVHLVRSVVDDDNLEARLFYQGMGWQLGDTHVPGWRKASVEYLWTNDPRG